MLVFILNYSILYIRKNSKHKKRKFLLEAAITQYQTIINEIIATKWSNTINDSWIVSLDSNDICLIHYNDVIFIVS